MGFRTFWSTWFLRGRRSAIPGRLPEEMDAVGGQLNAFTGKDCTCFYAKVIDEDLPLAVDILSDMTLHATLDEGELNKERGVILEEISMEEDSPRMWCMSCSAGCSLGIRRRHAHPGARGADCRVHPGGSGRLTVPSTITRKTAWWPLGGQLCARKGAGADGGILRRLGERGPGRGPAAHGAPHRQAGRQGEGHRAAAPVPGLSRHQTGQQTSCIPCPL